MLRYRTGAKHSTDETRRVADPAIRTGQRGADYRAPFGKALKHSAQLTKADVGLEVAFADLARWTLNVIRVHHRGKLAALLDELCRRIAALVTDFGRQHGRQHVVLTMSILERAVNENGNRGTTTVMATRCLDLAAVCTAGPCIREKCPVSRRRTKTYERR